MSLLVHWYVKERADHINVRLKKVDEGHVILYFAQFCFANVVFLSKLVKGIFELAHLWVDFHSCSSLKDLK